MASFHHDMSFHNRVRQKHCINVSTRCRGTNEQYIQHFKSTFQEKDELHLISELISN